MGRSVDQTLPGERLSAEDLVTFKALTRPMLDFLAPCVGARLNCLSARHRRRQDDAAQRALRFHWCTRAGRHHEDAAEPAPAGASRASRRVHRTSRAKAPSAIASSCQALACGPIALSSAGAARRRSTSSGEEQPVTTVIDDRPRHSPYALARIETMIAMVATQPAERAMRHDRPAIQIESSDPPQRRIAPRDGGRRSRDDCDIITIKDLRVREDRITRMGRSRGGSARPRPGRNARRLQPPDSPPTAMF